MPLLKSWYNSFELKREVLAAIERDAALSRFRPLEIDGRRAKLYGWPDPPDLQALRAMLGLPVGLLELGLLLFDDFPETEEGIRRVILARQRFLAAVPVGEELSWIVSEFTSLRLIDERVGVGQLVDLPDLHRLLDRVVEGLLDAEVEGEVEEALRVQLEHWSSEIPRQYQAHARVEPEVYAAVKVIETALSACRVPREPRAVREVVNAPLRGVATKRSCGGLDELAKVLLELLGSATRQSERST